MCSIDIAFCVESLIERLDGCSLEDLVAGAWEVQDHLDRLADGGDHPRGLERGLASMSAVAEQRTKLQVSPSLASACSRPCLVASLSTHSAAQALCKQCLIVCVASTNACRAAKSDLTIWWRASAQ